VPNCIESLLKPGNGNDRIPNKLARAVIGDVATAIDIDHLSTDAREEVPADRQVRSVAIPPDRVGVGMFEEK
jgi:hypothetical protein